VTTGEEPPRPGDPVHDTARDRVGRVMGQEGPYLQIRPLTGGLAWGADPRHLRRLTGDELLSAQLAEVNTRSRRHVK
jgi:hypothetical protein